LKGQERRALHENLAKADRLKSAMAILPPRPFRGSGKAGANGFQPAKRDGSSFTLMVNIFAAIRES
jgi:hypothetical protein